MPTRDDYFDHNWRPGLISQMILAQREKAPDASPNPAALKERFVAAGCPDIAKIVEYLCTEEGSELDVFGSGSIMPEGQTMDTPFSLEAAMGLRELYIGSKRNKLEPLEWLGYFSRFVDQVHPDARRIINSLCKSVVGVVTGKIKPEPLEDT